MLRKKYVMVVLLWLAGTAAYAWTYASSHAHALTSVGYEKDWEFQLLAFCVVRLPLLVAVLGVALLWMRIRDRR
jgi:hypothetical protein